MEKVCTLVAVVPHTSREDDETYLGTNAMPGGAKKNEKDVEQDLTDRLILSLVFDVASLAEDIEQVKVNIIGLARQRGLVKE